MKRILGYMIATTGLIAFVFFLKYKGTAIPLKELWFVLSLFIITGGIFFIVKDKWNNQRFQVVDDTIINQIHKLRLEGDRIKITPGNSEIKTRTFQMEITGRSFPTGTQMVDALYDQNRNYKTQEVLQTYIIFYKQYDSKTYKFISRATSQSADTLRWHMNRQDGVDLYIDKTNPGNYYFDLPFL